MNLFWIKRKKKPPSPFQETLYHFCRWLLHFLNKNLIWQRCFVQQTQAFPRKSCMPFVQRQDALGRDAFVPSTLLEVSLYPSCEPDIPLCSPERKTLVTFKQTLHKVQLPPVLSGWNFNILAKLRRQGFLANFYRNRPLNHPEAVHSGSPSPQREPEVGTAGQCPWAGMSVIPPSLPGSPLKKQELFICLQHFQNQWSLALFVLKKEGMTGKEKQHDRRKVKEKASALGSDC